MESMARATLDARNTEFWNELCGSQLARSLGITDHTPASLQRFDAAYLALYPYLPPYVTREALATKQVLEIGLGYAGCNWSVGAGYDANTEGDAPPHTDFVSRRQGRRSLFKDFSRVRIDTQNCDSYVFVRGRVVIPRERLLGTLGRVLGTDLYI